MVDAPMIKEGRDDTLMRKEGLAYVRKKKKVWYISEKGKTLWLVDIRERKGRKEGRADSLVRKKEGRADALIGK
jgi:hypothetical protein